MDGLKNILTAFDDLNSIPYCKMDKIIDETLRCGSRFHADFISLLRHVIHEGKGVVSSDVASNLLCNE